MDVEHMRLFAAVNDLAAAEAAGAPRIEIVEAVFDLLRFTGTNFTEEEVLMSAYEYPDLSEHRAAHDRFSLDLASAVSDFLVDREATVEPLLERVRGWLQDHIVTDDCPLAEYLRVARARKPAAQPPRRVF